jgi:hypothetical protein
LFNPGRLLVVRHLIGFLLAAAVTGILVMWTFDALHPYGSSTRTRMFDAYVALGTIAGVARPFTGILAGWLWRRRKRLNFEGLRFLAAPISRKRAGYGTPMRL